MSRSIYHEYLTDDERADVEAERGDQQLDLERSEPRQCSDRLCGAVDCPNCHPSTYHTHGTNEELPRHADCGND